jgi:hypothetical protein
MPTSGPWARYIVPTQSGPMVPIGHAAERAPPYLAGIKRILVLETEALRLRDENHRLRAEMNMIRALIQYQLPPA